MPKVAPREIYVEPEEEEEEEEVTQEKTIDDSNTNTPVINRGHDVRNWRYSDSREYSGGGWNHYQYRNNYEKRRFSDKNEQTSIKRFFMTNYKPDASKWNNSQNMGGDGHDVKYDRLSLERIKEKNRHKRM